ncbi:MAG: WD40/YVTN/BNR-like repeat-containing protein [Thermoleophilia bacterium]
MAILLLAGCAPWESAAPTTPTDTSRPPWLQIYTDIAFDGPSLGLICGWHGTMLRSVDKGQTWSEVVVPSAADLNSVAILNAGTAVAVGSGGNIIRSTDGGQTWIKITSPVNETLNAIASVGGGGAIAVGWHGTIIGTLDGGQTWTRRYDSPEPSLNFESVDFTPDGVGVVVSSSGLALKTVDSFRWLPLTLPDAGQKLFSVDLYDSNNAFVVGNVDAGHAELVGGKAVILKTENGGQVWGYWPRNLNADLLAVRYIDQRNAVTSGWDGIILRTSDGGSSWAAVVSPSNQALRALTVADATTVFAVGDGQTIIRSRDGGWTWERIRGS